jgi:hypothetical protein
METTLRLFLAGAVVYEKRSGLTRYCARGSQGRAIDIFTVPAYIALTQADGSSVSSFAGKTGVVVDFPPNENLLLPDFLSRLS